MKPAHIATFVAAGLLAGCGGPTPDDATASPPDVESTLPVPADPELAIGQRVYRGDCYNCHDRGKKGAPRIANSEDWTPRLTQGLETLVAHATQGFSGPTGSEMPARGGNEALTDAEISAAVQYMASHIR
jgi:cytochrome c5